VLLRTPLLAGGESAFLYYGPLAGGATLRGRLDARDCGDRGPVRLSVTPIDDTGARRPGPVVEFPGGARSELNLAVEPSGARFLLVGVGGAATDGETRPACLVRLRDLWLAPA
jgi:hypothetical protein